MRSEAWRAWKSIRVAAMLIALCPPAAEAQGARIFASLGTGEINGIYYPVGAAICAMVNRDLRDTGVRCSRELTPGSVYNVEAIRAGELEFAIVQSDVAFAAYNGNGAFVDRPFHELRSVLALYPELVTIVARPGIREIDDLAGKRINVGPKGSGTRLTWEAVQKTLGWEGTQAAQIVDLPADEIGEAVCHGTIDASLLVVGHPSAKVSALLARCATNLVAVKGPAIDSLVAATPYFTTGYIPGTHTVYPATHRVLARSPC